MKLRNSQKQSLWIGGLIFILLAGVSVVTGCDENVFPGDSSKTASVLLTVNWQDGAKTQETDNNHQETAPDCQKNGIKTISCQIYDTQGNLLISDPPAWPCEYGSRRLKNVPVGTELTFVVLAEDADGHTYYHGQTSGVTLRSRRTAKVVVNVYPFVPALISPDHDAILNPGNFAFAWNPLETANEYLLQVATDPEFNSTVLEKITPKTTAESSGLSCAQEYWWRIIAIDRFDNLSANSKIRHFTTLDCDTQGGNPSCDFLVTPTYGSEFGYEGGTGQAQITTDQQDCPWTAVSDVPWIRITSEAGGTGSGTITYEVEPSSGASSRRGTITVAGQQHSIIQQPAWLSCDFLVEPTHGSEFGYQGGTGQVRITADQQDCPWTAVSEVPWIRITSDADGIGSGTVTYEVDSYSGASSRQGTITVAGQQRIIIQQPAWVSCDFLVEPTHGSEFSYQGGTGQVRITADQQDCPWTVVSEVPWILITSDADGIGNGTVTYEVDSYSGADSRRGTIMVAGQQHVIIQQPQ